MPRYLILLTALTLCARLAWSQTSAPAPTLLRNGALVDANGDGVADAWTPQPPPNGKSTFITLRDGVVTLKDTDDQVGVGISQKVAALPEHRYTLRVQVRGGALPLYLRFFTAANQLIQPEHRIMAAGGPDWKDEVFSAVAPPAAAFVEVWFYTTSTGKLEAEVKNPRLEDNGVAATVHGPLISDAEYFGLLKLDLPGLEAVKAAVAKGDWPAARAAYLSYRRTCSPAHWNIDPAKRPAQPTAATDAAADKVLQHIFTMPYGGTFPEAKLGTVIDWTFNPLPPNDPNYTKEWTYIALNRMPAWDTLGVAYWKTLDEKYAREWVAQLESWVAANPVPYDAGAGDTFTWRTIETGIRMSGSWPNAYYRFLNSPSFTPEAHLRYAQSVWEHAQRLKKITVEQPGRTGNWVTMECNGLGTAALLFPEWKDSASLLKIAFDRLDHELSKQVYPDGGQVELAPNYHQVALNNFMELAQTAKLNSAPAPVDYLSKLKAMYEWDLHLMDQSGTLPPFNDSGPTSVMSSLREAANLWGDGEFKWILSHGQQGIVPPASTALLYSGYYTMRDSWDASAKYLAFDAGPVGEGHWHEDKLNLYLRAFGRTLLTEAGPYSYDQSKWRKYVLGTASHNTIMVDGKEQHRGDKASQLTSKPLDNPWLTSPLFDYAAGTYDSGYETAQYVAREYMPVRFLGDRDTSIKHTRHVIFLKPYYFVVVDFLEATGDHRYEAHFHLDAPAATLDDATKAVQTARKDNVQLGLFPLDTNGLSAAIVQGREAPPLGWIPAEKRAIPTVVYTRSGAAPQRFATLLYPYTGDKPQVSDAPLAADGNGAFRHRIVTPFETAEVILNPQQPVQRTSAVTPDALGGSFTTDAPLALLRQPKGKTELWIGVYAGTHFQSPAGQVSWTKPASLIADRANPTTWLFYNPNDKPLRINPAPPFGAALIPPGQWTEVTPRGALPATAPKFVTQPVAASRMDLPAYADYQRALPGQSRAAGARIDIEAEVMTLPEGVKRAAKVGARGEAIYGWDAPGAKIETTVVVPVDGLYHLALRYCTPQDAVRSLQLDGKTPFREAAAITFAPTQGAPPSDGWSNHTDDWKTQLLGAASTPGGWLFYLKQGKHTLAFTNESGTGMNLDYITLLPAKLALWAANNRRR